MAEIEHESLPVTLVRCRRCGSEDIDLRTHLMGGEVVRFCSECLVVYHDRSKTKEEPG